MFRGGGPSCARSGNRCRGSSLYASCFFRGRRIRLGDSGEKRIESRSSWSGVHDHLTVDVAPGRRGRSSESTDVAEGQEPFLSASRLGDGADTSGQSKFLRAGRFDADHTFRNSPSRNDTDGSRFRFSVSIFGVKIAETRSRALERWRSASVRSYDIVLVSVVDEHAGVVLGTGARLDLGGATKVVDMSP